MAPHSDYNHAVKCLNKLQTNFSVIQDIQKRWKQGASARDPDLIPEMVEWTRRAGYTPDDLNRLNVIHVTGTKGKGSTCAFVQSILLQYSGTDNDAKIGLYTSPHLKSVRERLMIQGKPISKEKFAQYFFEVFDRLDSTTSDLKRFPRIAPGTKPMYFRYLTLMSFHAFMQENVNTAIYEVGIGGEFDSTNVFVQPTACGVTSLGIDHTTVLGNTVEEIAWNKAGIFKEGCPAYTLADQPSAALKVLEDRAVEKRVSKFEAVPIHPQIMGMRMGLLGNFQERNATLACYLAAERLGITLNSTTDLPEKFVRGLQSVSWPGRCQIMETNPATRWFIDGAHTKESLEAAAEWLATSIDRSKPVSLVFNQQKRDNVEELLSGLHRVLTRKGVEIQKAYFTTNQSHDNGYLEEMISLNVSQEAVDGLVVQKKLAETWLKLSPNTSVHVCTSLEQVLKKAEGQVFATGSLLMVGALLSVLE